MADTKEAEAEITLETYDKHHVKVPKSIATRSAIINMMIEGNWCFFELWLVFSSCQATSSLCARGKLWLTAFSGVCHSLRMPILRTDTGDTNEVVPLADKSCTLSIINRVVEYLKKHAEFETSNADDEVCF